MEQFTKLLKELRSTSSSNEKQEILKNYPECKEQLLYVLDPYKMFGVTSKNLEKFPIEKGNSYQNWYKIKMLLDKLYKRELTGHDALKSIQETLELASEEIIESFCCFLDKDLKAGTGTKVINKVFKNLIPEFNLQLCYTLEDISKVPFKKTLASRKMDGERCDVIKLNREIKAYSKKGKEILTLNNLIKEVDILYKDYDNFVLDSEVCIIDENGIENFKAINKQIRRKDHTIKNPKLKIIDYLTYNEFIKGVSNKTFEEYYPEMLKLPQNNKVEVLEQIPVTSPEQLEQMNEEAKEKGWEGWILRNAEAKYKAKRHRDILKLKQFYDAEFTIIDTFEGEKNFTGMLGGIIVEGKLNSEGDLEPAFKKFFGNDFKPGMNIKIKCEVGSGFKEDERIEYWKNKNKLIGKTVTVKFFEFSENKNTKDIYSLRFPTLKIIH